MNQPQKPVSRWEKFRVLMEFFVTSLYYRIALSMAQGRLLRKLHANAAENEKLSPKQIRRLRLTRYAANHFEKKSIWRPKCYAMSLTTKSMLTKGDISSTLHIGFRMNQDKYLGHAWVSFKKRIICGNMSDLAFYHELQPIKSQSTDKSIASSPSK